MAYYPNYYQPTQYYQTPQYQMMPYQVAQNQQQNNGILWVGSELEAVNYLMAPNSAVALWNSNAPCIYLKQTDASGKPTMKTYDLVERVLAPSADTQGSTAEFITRQEFDALAARVGEIMDKDRLAKQTPENEGAE